jgi:hypothetical protein
MPDSVTFVQRTAIPYALGTGIRDMILHNAPGNSREFFETVRKDPPDATLRPQPHGEEFAEPESAK